jgi:predicted DNA binding CopG/RHH family protein
MKNNKIKRNNYIHFRLNDAEFEAVKTLANFEGVSLSEVVRMIMRERFKQHGINNIGLLGGKEKS